MSASSIRVSEIEKSDKDAPEQGFAGFFAKLPPKPDTTIRLFDRNDYYTVHGNDAIFVAKEFYITLAILKENKIGSIPLVYINISKPNFEKLIQDLLLVRRYCVEIYKKAASRSTDFVLDCKASPGNLSDIEDLLYTSSEVTDSQSVIAVKVKKEKQQMVVGVSCGDAILRKFQVSEFVDDDNFTLLQAVIIQLGPKECLIPSGGDQTYKLIKQLAEKNYLLVSECKLSTHFASKDLNQDLNRLIRFGKNEPKQINKKAEYDLSIAMDCTMAVAKYLELTADENNFNQFVLSTFHPEHFVRLDVAAVKALAILPKTSKDTATGHSMLGLLNKCRTAGGQRLLSQWLKQPLIDIARINERLDVVEEFLENTELRHTLYEISLRKVPDLQRFSKKFQRKKASLQDCYRVYLMLLQIPKLRHLLEKFNGKHQHILNHLFCEPLMELEMDFSKFQQLVVTTLDMDEVEKGEFMIKSDFDDDLKELREELSELEDDIKNDAKHTSKDLGLESEKVLKLEKTSQIGWHYRISKAGEKTLRNRKNYYTIDTKNNGVRFHSEQLRNLNSTFITLRDKIESHQKKVVDMIIEIGAGYSEPMNHLCDLLSHLDVLVSFSMVAINAPIAYTRPILKEKGTGVIRLIEARHPLVEVHKTTSFIANDIKLAQHDSIFHIITGPNMGGKSTYIRSVALNVLLAQIGCFVACKEAEISVVDAILTRVGAGDKPTRGISTFMAEMLETSAILKSATQNSLVIIDELGRGTSTYDGFGLAWAISEYLVKNIKAFVLFATHFHELTYLADEIPKVKNYHVTALTDDDNFVLLYKVQPGVCDQSFGIEVAELAHFPKHIVQMAREKVSEFEALQGCNFISQKSCEGPSAKRQRTEEADAVINDFLMKVKALPIKTMSDSEISNEMEKLKQEVKQCSNPQIQKLIALAIGED